jgi:Fanconi anemia group J protein
MTSFKSELGATFDNFYVLEADHVIPRANSWIGTLGKGPNGTMLELKAENLKKPEVVRDVGLVILDTCNAASGGILVFFPSYKAMYNLKSNWVRTGLIEQMQRTKKVFEESKTEDFQAWMKRFSDAIDCYSNNNNNNSDNSDTINGCLLFAVYRGKVSEGMDFADAKARAIVAIGVPYSYFGDEKLHTKREYNEGKRRRLAQQNQGSNHVLSGFEYYENEAFRGAFHDQVDDELNFSSFS